MAVGFEKLVKDTADTMKKAGKKKTSEHNAVGVVKRVDGKTAWVHFEGGVDETPVKMTIGANVGDKVRVHIGGGKAYIIGNETSPPTDDRQANKAIQYTKEVEKTADTATEKIEDIEYLVGDGENSGITISTQYYLSSSNTELVDGEWTDVLPVYQAGYYYWIKTVTVYADGSEIESEPMLDINNQITAEVNAVVTAENQHFWHDSSGAYVTNAEGSYSSGYAMKITTYGLLQTYDGNNLMSLTSSGLSFYQSDGSTPLATYSSGGCFLYGNGTLGALITSSGTTIYGGSTANRAEMTSSGMQVYANGALTATFSSSITLGDSSGYNAYFSAGELGVKNGSTTHFYASPNGLYYRSGYYWGMELNGRNGLSVSVNDSAVFQINSNGVTANTVSAGILYVRTPGVASSDTANCRIATGESNRIMFTSSSSKEVKHAIKPVSDAFLDPHKLYNVDVVQFVYNLDYLDENDKRYDLPVVGFIAEDLYKIYPIAVDFEKDKPHDWNARYIIPPMLSLIQEQKKEIDSLINRVNILEERSRA